MALFKRIWGIFSGSRSINDTQETGTDYGASPFGRGHPFLYDPFNDYGTEPPHEPGIYWSLNEDNERLYYGETNDLFRRMKEHVRTRKIQPGEKFVYKPANKSSSSETRRSVERQKIRRHGPRRNQRGGGAGRKPL